MQRFEEAHKLYKLTVDISSKQNPMSPLVAEMYMNLAQSLFEQNKYAEAVEAYEKSLDITLVATPDDHSRISTTHKKLALAYERVGNTSEAERHMSFATNVSFPHISKLSLNNTSYISMPKIDYHR